MTTWTCSHANEDGFAAMKHFKKLAAERSEEEFMALHPVPALLVVDRASSPKGILEYLFPEKSGYQLVTETIKGAAILRYLGKVAFVTKQPGNPYPHLISIGRSPKNDITMGVESVSKVHGYFVVEEGGWHFTDHDSTNGSKLNGKKLQSGQKYALGDQAELRLGLEATLQYMSPSAFYHHVRSG